MSAAGALVSRDEPRGSGSDDTEFELYGPGASVGPGYNLPAPGSGIVAATYPPEPLLPEAWVRFATLPATCGNYLLRSAVIGTGDDDNGWRVRVGTDDDTNPNNPAPPNSDDSDGLPGTSQAMKMVGALLTYGLIACVAGIAIAATVWAIGSHSANPHHAGAGKKGVLIAAGAAILIGSADALVTFFSNIHLT